MEGIFKDLLHPENIPSILVFLEIFHFDKSGRDINDSQLLNIYIIEVTLFTFHLDKLGRLESLIQLLNIPFKSVTLAIFHFDISGIANNDSHPLNK